MEFLGMGKGQTVDLQQHLRQVADADTRAYGNRVRADRLEEEYERLFSSFQAEIEAHKLTKAALLAMYDQVKFIKETDPASPAFKLTNEKYRSGNRKSVARLKMEEAMKEHGRKLGVAMSRILKFLDS